MVTVFISFFLIVSESSFFRGYFLRNHPLLSASHGFIVLGLALLALGCTTLGQLNKSTTTSDAMGLGFWRIVIGSGILGIVFGVLNLLASFIFRDKANGVTARQIRGKGAVALTQAPTQQPWHHVTYEPHNKPGSFYTATSTTKSAPKEQTTKVPWKQRFSRFKPSSILPIHHNQPNHRNISRPMNTHPSPPSTHVQPQNSGGRFQPVRQHSYDRPYSPPPASSFYGDHEEEHERQKSMQISGPLNVNPQFAHLVPQFATMQRPDSAFHPARAGGK